MKLFAQLNLILIRNLYGGNSTMEWNVIAKSTFESLLVCFCLLGIFIILHTKMNISPPSYISIPILLFIYTFTFQYLAKKIKDRTKK